MTSNLDKHTLKLIIGGFMRFTTKLCYSIIVIVVALSITTQLLFAQATGKERSNIPEKYTWKLDDLFPTLEEWQKSKEAVAARFDKLESFKGKLGNSAQDLYEAVDYGFDVVKDYYRVAGYASRLSDQDTRESGPMAMKQEISQLGTKLNKISAYAEPEVLKIPQEKLEQFFKEEPRLEPYRQYIDDIQRRKAHTLNESEEVLLAEAGRMSGTAQSTYSIFSNADMPRPTIKLSDEREVRLDAAGYTAYRALNVREDRINVFEAFFGALNDFQRLFGTQLNGEVQKNIFYKNTRNYDSCLERALDGNNIPTSVYHKLIENTNKNLATVHRYLKLRKRMLGIDELHYYDMYPSLVKEVDLKYSFEEATEIIKEALAVLGKEYVATLDKAFNERWIDVYPNTGKVSGAYSSGSAYDVHPYILMNYNDQYEDMSTLAHELGHTMHSYFSNKNQPFVNANYPIFLAEVASTANEAILIDHVLKGIKEPEKRLSILGSQLEGFRTTMFRQTQFAEFELKIHELAEKGEALTGDKFTEIYLDILKKYYGHEQGITVIDDLYGIEWAYIPHFYYNFYVYQYSTSFMASQALAEKMLSGDPSMVKNYLNFLSSGSSEYAIPTLKKVGLDMTTDEPFNIAIKKMNKIMDDIEKILTDMGK
jgi:oligoendopeptidase F